MPPKKKKSSQEKVEEIKAEGTVEDKPVENVIEKVKEKTEESDLEKEIMADLENLDKDVSTSENTLKPSGVEKEPETIINKPEESISSKGSENLPVKINELSTNPESEIKKEGTESDQSHETPAEQPITQDTVSSDQTPTETLSPTPNPTPEPASVSSEGVPKTATSSMEPVTEASVEEEELPEEAEAEPEPAPAEAEGGKKKALDKHTMKNIIEAALFVAGRPISVEELNIKTELKKRDIEELLKELILEYMERNSAIEIVQMGDKFSMQVQAQFTQNVKKFASGGLIPEPVLKTLTIIALKQPMMKNMLIKIRGAGAYDHVKFLIDRGFIQSQKKGRSEELVTTEQFSDTFGLSRDLETLKKQLIAQLGVKEESSPAPKEG